MYSKFTETKRKTFEITFFPSQTKEPKLKSRDLTQLIYKDPMSFETFYLMYTLNINRSYHLHESYVERTLPSLIVGGGGQLPIIQFLRSISIYNQPSSSICENRRISQLVATCCYCNFYLQQISRNLANFGYRNCKSAVSYLTLQGV